MNAAKNRTSVEGSQIGLLQLRGRIRPSLGEHLHRRSGRDCACPERRHEDKERLADACPFAPGPFRERPTNDGERPDGQEDADQVEQPVAVPEAVVGDDANGFAGLAAPVGLEQ